jgi:2-oxoisovalerate dehydrogenase E2 component (dihydrolipoyl transacylase)
MGRYVVKLPDIGEGTTEAEIVVWHVSPGQVIREEDPLVDIMTDKATVELPAPVAGTVVALHGEVGDKRPVGSELVVLEVAGEGNVAAAPAPPLTARDARPAELFTPTPTSSPQAPPQPSPAIPGSSPGRGGSHPMPGQSPPPHPLPNPPPLAGEGRVGAAGEGRVGAAAEHGAPSAAEDGIRPPPIARRAGDKPLASPAVRRRAWDLGIALQFVPGTGPAGRITRADLDAYIAAPAAAPAPARHDGVEEVPIIGLRRAIAERLQESKRHIPHFSYVEEVDVTALEELRGQLNATDATREHLTLLPFLMRAIVTAVGDHPEANARYDDEAGVLRRYQAVNIGVATQTAGGLMVPVVHHVEALDLWQSAAELRRLAEAARGGKATRNELTGSTITITSLGALGGIAATPVINYPEVAIVGVNRIAERPVVREGAITVRKMMNLSSSFDHRIVDGWMAASFVQRIKQLLEQPALLFIA